MDLFILDSQLRRTAVFDQYETLIWTERFSSAGDFELVIPSSLKARSLLTPGTYLAINESTRIMVIETVEDRKDSDGKVYLNIKGPSLESILDARVAKNMTPNTDVTDVKWYFTDVLPAEIAREIFNYVCVEGNIHTEDIIPFYVEGNIYPPDNIPEPEDPVSLVISPTSVYQAIKEICDIYDLGFRLVRNGDESELMFNIYSGNDRTTLQSTLPAVIFAPELDNLTDVSYLTAVGNYKNVAHVISPNGETFVYANNVDESVSGFDRKVLFVDASDILYPDRSQLDPLPYTITDDEAAVVRAVQSLINVTDFQSSSLGKITQMRRLYPQDKVNIEAVINNVYSLTSSEASAITLAKAASGVTQDQKDALSRMEASVRLSNSDLSSLNTMLANNANITNTNKQYISDAANKQQTTVMSDEKTLIEDLIERTDSYNDAEDAALLPFLIQRGKDELAKNTNLVAFDGEIPENSQYVYHRDYELGDLVEIRNSDQVTNQMRVTEQIFASDATGDRAYPTLSIKQLITAGSWYAEPAAEVWDDLVNPADTWESRP